MEDQERVPCYPSGMTNPNDPTDWRNINLVALSPRGREVARRIAAMMAAGKKPS